MPKRPPRLCPGCRQLVTDERCPRCTPPAFTQRQQPTRRHPSRVNSRAWRRTRAAVFAQQHYICATPDCMRACTELDHITAIADGGTDNRDNLQGLCATCHRTKTQRESNRNRPQSDAHT